jgi:NUDIX domain-containing protein
VAWLTSAEVEARHGSELPHDWEDFATVEDDAWVTRREGLLRIAPRQGAVPPDEVVYFYRGISLTFDPDPDPFAPFFEPQLPWRSIEHPNMVWAEDADTLRTVIDLFLQADVLLAPPTVDEVAQANPADDLGLVEVDELGVRFATGEPVTFPFMHSTESAPYLGAQYGQDVEPAGFYLLSDTSRAAEHPTPGWEYGEISFQSPLVLAMTTTDDPMEPIYGPSGWKARLNRAYGLGGADLSRALLAAGYDAVVTVWVQGDQPGGTREIVDLRPVAMTANPLDPYAYDREGDPFIIQGQATSREQHLGVHTAETIEAAATYAVQRAMIDGTLGIIFHLDVTGLDPLPDRDAIMKADSDPSWLFDAGDELAEAVEAGDEELVEELLQDQADGSEWLSSEGGAPTDWTEGAVDALTEAHDNALMGVLIGLEPGELLAALQMLAARRALPARVWMEVMGQQRYMSAFGLDRVVQIDAIRPIRDELWTWEERQESGDDYPPDDPDQPELFADMSFADGQWMPQTVALWRNPDARPGAQVEYHGTDIVRARSAFPELAEVLANPWPYTQLQVERVVSMFSTPQHLIEAHEAAKPGVGLFPVAQTTGRFLMGERSWAVDEPGQWSGFGGKIEGLESPELAAVRELREETGYAGPIDLEEIAPRIFLGHVPDEYAPRLNWETEQARWLTAIQVAGLEPKHWGTDVLLSQLS